MIFESDILQQKDIGELRAMLAQRGASWHPREKKTTLINRYIEISSITQPNEKKRMDETEVKDKVKAPTPHQTIDDVLNALESHKAAGLMIKFNEEATMWRFTDGKREDSGTMLQPLKTIVRCADMIVRPNA